MEPKEVASLIATGDINKMMDAAVWWKSASKGERQSVCTSIHLYASFRVNRYFDEFLEMLDRAGIKE